MLICSLNAPSLRKHKEEIEVLMRENKIDVFAINETKPDSKTKDEQVSVEGYNILPDVTETLMRAGLRFTSEIH